MDVYLVCHHRENQNFHAKMDLKKLKLQKWPEGGNGPPSRKENASHHILPHPTNPPTRSETQARAALVYFRSVGRRYQGFHWKFSVFEIFWKS